MPAAALVLSGAGTGTGELPLVAARTASHRRTREVEVEVYSESQSDRAVLSFRGPAGEAATVIVMRKGTKVWLVFNGAVKTTVAMSDPEAAQLIEAVNAASRRPQ